MKCEKCGSIFIAEEVEYKRECSYGRGENVLKYETTCPICDHKIIEFRRE